MDELTASIALLVMIGLLAFAAGLVVGAINLLFPKGNRRRK